MMVAGEAIASGLLTAGSRLPPTRQVAAQLKVSRQLVVIAYERLHSEGMIEGQHGSGSFVSQAAGPFAAGLREGATRRKPMISERANELLGAGSRNPAPDIPPLSPGIPDTANFPFHVVARIAARFWRRRSEPDLAYGDSLGVAPLRQSVANFLRSYRGVPCSEEQVVITSGSQASFIAAAHVVADPGDVAIVENPGHIMVHHALTLAGLQLHCAGVDREGLDLTSARPYPENAKLLVCTPAHHFPLGVAMPLSRRLEALHWADETGGYVVEDDYDSEFRYEGAPVPSLSALDKGGGRVIYAGTFSKLLAPGLRMGFLVVPEALIEAFRGVRAVIDRHPSSPMQHICAEFIAGGHLAAHIRKMKPIYAERRAALLGGLREHLAEDMELVGTQAGLHACLLLRTARQERLAKRLAEDMGLGCRTLSSFAVANTRTAYWGLAFGYATTDAGTTFALAEEFSRRLKTMGWE